MKADDIVQATKSVIKEWSDRRKAEGRGRSRGFRQYAFSDRVHFTEVAEKILPDAYLHASGGKYTVSKRQFYYAARDPFREHTGRGISFATFDTLLVKYQNQNAAATESWKITADPRGNLTIPNAGHDVTIPCGTIAIGDHLEHELHGIADAMDDLPAGIRHEWPSLAAGQRYRGVLYIEKEGFNPMMEEARIAERFDLAILSCKGQSVVAARRFVDQVCRVDGGVPLFVVHDMDKAGFEISVRLTSVSDWARKADRVAYEFENEINVTDLGLCLVDCQKYGLQSEPSNFKGTFASDSIATDEEREFLRGNRRIELNAFTAPQFIEWLESKLVENLGPERWTPDDSVLENTYRRALAVAEINLAIETARTSAIEKYAEAAIPKTLKRQLKTQMKDSPAAWDKAIYRLARKNFLSRHGVG